MVNPQKLALCPRLIGRASQLELLDSLLEQARGDQGQVVLIGGDAGIGKSRLVTEGISHAQTIGFSLLQGNCYEPDRHLPYAPILDLLWNLSAVQSPQELAAEAAPFAPDLINLLPELGVLLPGFQMPPSRPEPDKKGLFQALLQFLVSRSTNRPCLLVIEDLHWSDDSSLEFLLYLARHLQARPLLLLLTYRTDETNIALNTFLAQLDRERRATEIILTAFSRSQLEEMIRAIFDLEQPVRGEFLARISALTEGNPFFVEEILRSLIAAGEIYQVDGRWERKPIQELDIPRSVRDAVQRRTEQLDPAAQSVLALAAVLGRRFDFRLLQELTMLDESDLVRHMKQLVNAQMVIEESADEFVFRHALTREAVYGELLLRERKALHQSVSVTLERLYADALDAHVTDLAYHYYAAGAWDKALEYARRAGEKAAAMYAPREAIQQFTRALEAAEKLSHPVRARLYITRGRANETIGDFDAALADFEQALVVARRTQDSREECEAQLELGFLWASRDYGRTGKYFQDALALARTLHDAPTLARTLNRVGNWYVNIEQPQVALGYHQEALNIFSQVDDQHGLAETFDLLGMASEESGDPLQFTNYYHQAIMLFREIDDRQGLASSLASIAVRGETYFSSVCVALPVTLAEVVADAEAGLKSAQEAGWRAGECYALGILSMCQSSYGEYERALHAIQEAMTIAQEIEHPQWLALSYGGLGEIYMDLLALDDAQQQLEQSLALGHQVHSDIFIHLASALLALAVVRQNNLSHAESVLDAAIRPLRERFVNAGQGDAPLPTVSERLCLAADVELALAHGDSERALQIVDNLIRTAPNLTPQTVIPRLWNLRGQALTRLKRFKESEHVLLTARNAAETRGLRPILWRIRLALGKLYQQQDRRKDADAEYTAARTIVQQLAEGLADARLREKFLKGANELLPRPRATSSRRAEKERFGGLTEREREIAGLIATGNSNREIAERLVLSERTVITHITNILNKLGFTSRTQIAVWANESGLAPPHSIRRRSEN